MSEVYRLTELDNPLKVRELLRKVSGIEKGALVAVKLHMGETFTHGFIKPPFVKEIVTGIKEMGGRPFITDTTTLYPRGRFTAVDYLETARKNGFDSSAIGAPVIIADGLTGEDGVIVETGGKLVEKIEVGQAIHEADYLVTLTHCTGHISVGYGGAIKNLGMGCMTKNGKRTVHGFSMPQVDTVKCEKCGACVKVCPYSVIQMKDFPKIDAKRCVGCCRCVTVCPTQAMHQPDGWFDNYIRALAEAANSVVRKFGENACFVNFITDVTAMCDCGVQEDALIPDVGILASGDILSVDRASYDLIKEAAGKDILKEAWNVDGELQFGIAEELGMGSKEYEIK